MALVSIIIPAFNCEKTICKTIESIIEQSYKNIELIVVNDGSNDKTLEVVNEYNKLYGNIKVISIKNSGPAKARNHGLNISKGKYVIFVDSDDILEKDMIENLYYEAKKCNSEITFCGYYKDLYIDNNLRSSEPILYKNMYAHNKDECLKHFFPLMINMQLFVVWNKLLLREIIIDNGVKFMDYGSGEDRIFNIDVFKLVNRISFINKPLYHYSVGKNDSITSRHIPNKFEAMINFYDKCKEIIDLMEYNEQNYKVLNYFFIKGIISCMIFVHDKNLNLSIKERKIFIKKVMLHKKVQVAAKGEGMGSAYKIMCFLIKSKLTYVNFFVSKIIYVISVYMPDLCLKIKKIGLRS